MNMNADEYRFHIDRLIREKNGEVVLNGSHSHATIIIERMFANAENDVSILSRRFDPRIYGTPELVEQAELFLAQPDRTAHIVLEEMDEAALADHPFFARLAKFIEKGNLSLRKVPDRYADLIKINFAVMDDNGYRFEKDKRQAIASAAFGVGGMANNLRNLFDDIWALSEPKVVSVNA